jgi:transposase
MPYLQRLATTLYIQKVVDAAKELSKGIKLEDLTGIRNNKNQAESFRYAKNSWSFYQCYRCGLKDDADLNAAYNIALRCQDDWLKVQMNPVENRASA